MGRRKFWNFVKNEVENTGELQLYGEISDSSWWGDEVTPKDFKSDLDALGDISQLNVFINSPGGDVFAGQAIYSMLKRHKASVTVYVDGLAASAASLVAMAGDNIKMPENAMLMVHNAWTIASGNAGDFRKLADDMDKINASIRTAYLAKAPGLTEDKITELMDAETWLSAQEAVDYGLADEVEDPKQYAASIKGRLFKAYRQVPSSVPNPEPKQNIDDTIERQKAKLALQLAL